MITTIIGRGHSGTSLLARTLHESGVYIGDWLNATYDLMGFRAMYEACRIAAQYVRWEGGLSWDWSGMIEGEIPDAFTRKVETYLAPVMGSDAGHKGWKLPETVLCLPWIVRMYPEVRYIYLIRDPRDVILRRHKVTDDLENVGIQYPHTENTRRRRAISWWYQYLIVQATPRPEHRIDVRFEDLVLRQDETLARLEAYLGIDLARVPVRTESVGRYKRDTGRTDFDFFRPALVAYGYEGAT